jgi:hypothetical protein
MIEVVPATTGPAKQLYKGLPYWSLATPRPWRPDQALFPAQQPSEAMCLQADRFTPVRSLVGNYTTSLDMAGALLTVTVLDDELVSLWNAPVHTAALRW